MSDLVLINNGGVTVKQLRAFLNNLPKSIEENIVSFESHSGDFNNRATSVSIRENQLLIED